MKALFDSALSLFFSIIAFVVCCLLALCAYSLFMWLMMKAFRGAEA